MLGKYIVLCRFIDKDTKEIYEVGQEIELSEDRAREIRSDITAEYISKVEEEPHDED